MPLYILLRRDVVMGLEHDAQGLERQGLRRIDMRGALFKGPPSLGIPAVIWTALSFASQDSGFLVTPIT